MSSIRFHTLIGPDTDPDGYGRQDPARGRVEPGRRRSFEISGAERAHLSMLIGRVAQAPSDYVGNPVTFAAALNLAMEREPLLRLPARVHGQCEIHGYVEGHHRRWLADLVFDLLQRQVRVPGGVRADEFEYSSDVLRAGMSDHGSWRPPGGRDLRGWLGLVEWLRVCDREAVVMSYSVSGWFPSADTPWAMALGGLREHADLLALTPENWSTYRFLDSG